MNRLMRCSTCNGEGRIVDRRDNNRDEEEEINEKVAFVKAADEVLDQLKNGSKYNYDCKIPYDDSAKDLIKQLRKSGHKIRVRGSGARAKWSLKDTNGRTARCYDSHIPLKYASHVRLYITK